jgi:hypothetical protein
LQEIIKGEIRDENKKESMRFKVQTALAFPEAAARIFSQSEENNEFIAGIEELDPDSPGFSQEGIDSMLSALESFGFHIEDM